MVELLLDDGIVFAVLATLVTGLVLTFLIRDPWVRRFSIWRWTGMRSHRHRGSAQRARARHRRAA